MDEQVEKTGTLNLDEILGESKLKVRLSGKEYAIRSVKSLTPQEFGRVMAYGTKFASLTEEEFANNNGETVLKAIDDLIEIIAPSLPRHKPTLKERFTRGYKRRFSVSLQEATAIMQWAVEGLKEWMRIGLAPPAKVLEATEDYRAEMDILGDFLEDKCCTGENLEATNKEVYGAYQEWAKSQGLGVRSQKWLSRALKDRGFRQAEGRADGRKWVGFSVLAAPIFGQPRPDPRLAEHLF